MKSKMNKKAQFYLISAAVIIVIISGIYATVNYLSRKPIVFYDLSSELKREGASVIDHGIWKTGDTTQINELMKNFTENYFSKYAEEKDTTELVYIYGDTREAKITITKYAAESTGEICLGTGCIKTVKGIVKSEPRNIVDNKIKVTLADKDYEFELTSGQNFYFVIKQKIGEETQISQD